jgi:hypothetical protein
VQDKEIHLGAIIVLEVQDISCKIKNIVIHQSDGEVWQSARPSL